MKHRALITGASRGLGRELALSLSQDSSIEELILIARNLEELQKLRLEILESSINKKITIGVVDLSKETEIVYFIDQLKKDRLPDILINNAGYCWQGSLNTMNMENLERVFTLNTIAPFSLILKLLPSMKQQQWGRIINISSISTTKIHQNLIAYSASKIALETISEGIHLDANNAGITCNAILPGLMLTEMGIESIRKAYPSYKIVHNRSDQEIELALMKQLNTKERTAISDVCKLVQFLISDKGGLVSGESLSCNSRYWP